MTKKLLSETKLAQVERILRRIRQRIFDYPDAKQDKASRIIRKLKAKAMPNWDLRARQVAAKNDRYLNLWA